jgi:hypothetical protein
MTLRRHFWGNNLIEIDLGLGLVHGGCPAANAVYNYLVRDYTISRSLEVRDQILIRSRLKEEYHD